MSLAAEQAGEIRITRRSGEPALVVRVGAHRAAGLAEVLRDAVADAAGRARHLVVDLTGVRTLDPDQLAVLVRARQQVRQAARGWVCLAGPSPFVLTVLHVMRLEPAFPVFATCADALSWLDAADRTTPVPGWAALDQPS